MMSQNTEQEENEVLNDADFSDREEDYTDKIEVEDEILQDEDIEELHMNKDSDFNDRVKNNNATIKKSIGNGTINNNNSSLTVLNANDVKLLPVN